ncbi:hypothetical protein B0H19DRAFT_1373822 [Mycena capillaripes]|nr:hypothetical protein B0H19DRAFT_1373822 [Mycena capillaripes]
MAPPSVRLAAIKVPYRPLVPAALALTNLNKPRLLFAYSAPATPPLRVPLRFYPTATQSPQYFDWNLDAPDTETVVRDSLSSQYKRWISPNSRDPAAFSSLFLPSLFSFFTPFCPPSRPMTTSPSVTLPPRAPHITTAIKHEAPATIFRSARFRTPTTHVLRCTSTSLMHCCSIAFAMPHRLGSAE